MATNLFDLSDPASVLNLFNKAAEALRRCGGSLCRYYATAVELDCLGSVLRKSQALQPSTNNPDLAQTVHLCANACHSPLDTLVSKIRKYEERFDRQHWDSSFSTRSGTKVQWALAIEAEVMNFKALTGPYLSTINVLLQLESLQRLSTMPNDTSEDAMTLATTLLHQIDALRDLVQEQATSYSQLAEIIPLLDHILGTDSLLRQARAFEDAEEARVEIDRLHYREKFMSGFAEASQSPDAPDTFRIPPAPVDSRCK